jgi:prolipoprotein diacylglyceryltransferase
MTYGIVYVFHMANLTRNADLINSGVQYALFIIFTSVIFFFIDKTRRPLLMYGAIGMGICQFVVGGIMARVAQSSQEELVTCQTRTSSSSSPASQRTPSSPSATS